jgi:sodium-independent sulfate anion transporter 11
MTRKQVLMRKCCWLLGTARNAIVVIISVLIMYLMSFSGKDKLFTLTSAIKQGLPPFEPPHFVIKNGTTTYRFTDLINQFESGLIIIPLLAFIEAMAIGKAFGRLNNYKIQPSQELIAIGVSNILGSFVSAYPVTGSFSRTAVNSNSGVRTPAGGIFTGILVLLAARFVAEAFQLIPRAVLGGVIITAVLPMVDFTIARKLWRIKRLDLIPWTVTFVGCFYTLEFGLIAGMSCSLLLVLWPILRPSIEVRTKDVTTILTVRNGLDYPGIEHLMKSVEEQLQKTDTPIAIIIDMGGVSHLDYSCVKEIAELLTDMRTSFPGTDVLVTNLNSSVRYTLECAEMGDIITSSQNLSERFEARGSLVD